MNKKFLCVLLALVLAVTPMMLFSAYALPEEKEELEDRINEIDAEIAANKQKLEALKDKKDKHLRIFKKHDTDDMYLATLKKELLELNPNLEASIRRSGVTRFSVYLNRMIGSVEVNGRHVLLK